MQAIKSMSVSCLYSYINCISVAMSIEHFSVETQPFDTKWMIIGHSLGLFPSRFVTYLESEMKLYLYLARQKLMFISTMSVERYTVWSL